MSRGRRNQTIDRGAAYTGGPQIEAGNELFREL
jgi:hypothetical protein